MHKPSRSFLVAASLAGLVGLLVWTVAGTSDRGVSLQLRGYVTNRLDEFGTPVAGGHEIRTTICITNNTRRPLQFSPPGQALSHFFTTADGTLVHGSRIPISITLDPAQGTNFTVPLFEFQQSSELVLEYSQPSPVDPLWRILPAWLSGSRPVLRLWDWLHPTRTVSLAIRRPDPVP